MKYKIIKVLSSTTIEISPRWSKGEFSGERLRIAGVRKLAGHQGGESTPAQMRKQLEGKSLSISLMYYVEQGPTLVATVEIEGTTLRDVFTGRFDMPLPRTRMMEFGDNRCLRAIEGGREARWKNPLRILELEDRPCIGGFPFPLITDPEFVKGSEKYGES